LVGVALELYRSCACWLMPQEVAGWCNGTLSLIHYPKKSTLNHFNHPYPYPYPYLDPYSGSYPYPYP
jgi:hypothetical protein